MFGTLKRIVKDTESLNMLKDWRLSVEVTF